MARYVVKGYFTYSMKVVSYISNETHHSSYITKAVLTVTKL